MFIKLTLICAAFAPSIIGRASENPADNGTRVSKLFGWLSVANNNDSPLKFITSTNRRWQGEVSLTLGWRPLIASVGFYRKVDFRDSIRNVNSSPAEGNHHNHLEQSDAMSDTSNDLNDTSTSDTYITATEAVPLGSTAETFSSTLKLEDYEEITSIQPQTDDDDEENRVRREIEPESVHMQRTADDDLDSTTTIETNTISMNFADIDGADYVTLAPPALASSNHNFYYVPSPYPKSQNPAAQHISITYSPHHKPYQPTVKNYYDFHPSPPDYNRPYCINSIHHKFTPVLHDTWSTYHKWK